MAQILAFNTKLDADALKAACEQRNKEVINKLYDDLLADPPKQSSIFAMRMANIEALRLFVV
jgi:hypothetical protein